MDAGKLNRKIRFVKKGSGSDENGFPIEKWVSVKTVWASVETERGGGFFSAAADQHVSKALFCCRYFKGISRDWNVLYDEKIYDIKDAVNEEGRRVFIRIMCEEVPNGT